MTEPASSASQSPLSSLLRLTGIAHRFGRRWVLRGAELELHPGEVVALAGGNGAGKTTLLRVAATLLQPLRGEVRLLGSAVGPRDGNEIRRLLGFLGHSPALYEDLTALENLRFAFRMHGLPVPEGKLEATLDEVGLLPHAGSRVRRFSSGMRRRLALARTLIARPALLLMDEPYASLDADGVELVNRMVERVVAEGGGVLMATHDFRAGERVTTRVVGLQEGRIIEASSQPTAGEP